MRRLWIASVVLWAAGTAVAFAQQATLNRADADFIFGKRNAQDQVMVEGAEDRVQLFYHYFNKDRDSSIPAPAWIDQTLPAMLRRPVWQDPDQGVLNEAQLWQSPASVLYEFFELVRKSLPPDPDKGQSLAPGGLLRDYEDNRVRFQISIDRLRRARLGGALAGRGRAIMADYDLLDSQLESVIGALLTGDGKRYRDSVMAAAALSDAAFRVLQSPPRGYAPGVVAPPRRGISFLWILLGTACAILAGFLFGTLNEEGIHQLFERYRTKAKEWAYEYERQFVIMRVHYLVGIPAGLGILAGVLTWNFFGFLIFAGLGLITGLRFPGWLLRNIRQRRGAKVETQLMDAVILMSNGLKSGIDLVGCIEMVTKELQPPISEEFGLCLKNYHLGTKLETALESVEERVQSRLLSYMIKAVVVQRSVGGNLTKIFDRIVENIREESKLIEKTAAMTAQQRIQSIVVGIMPWVMFLVMFAFQFKIMSEFYFSPTGVVVIFASVVWMSVGMAVVRKLGDVTV